MLDFIAAAFDVALSLEPFTVFIWSCMGVACVWRAVWFLVGGMTCD